jgi:uncharacterized integral membrane protein (TIGR00698 family)
VKLSARADWLPGLLLAMALATAALVLGDLPFLRDTLHLGALLLVILLGMALASLAVLPDLVVPGVRLAQRPVLRWAVAGLGFRLSLGEVVQIGAAGLAVVTVSTIGSLAFGWWIARRLGVPEKLGLLLAVGTAICGASAIVAADSVVQAEKRETAVALGVITLFGTAGIILYPWLGRMLGLNDQLFGIWDGASLHETAQVVAAGFGMSEEAARVATVVKLARICLLAPIVLWLAWWLPRHQPEAGAAKVSAVPWFLVMFLVFAAVNSTGVIPEVTLKLLRRADLWLLCVGMAGVGLQTGVGELRAAGVRPLLAGLLQWIVLAVLSLGLAMAVSSAP